MKIVALAIFAVFFSAATMAQNLTVLKFTNETSGKTFTSTVAEGSQAFISETNGASYVIVPENDVLKVYRPSQSGIVQGRKGLQVSKTEIVLIQSAAVRQGVARLDQIGLSVNVVSKLRSEVLLEQALIMEQQEKISLASGKPITFAQTVMADNAANLVCPAGQKMSKQQSCQDDGRIQTACCVTCGTVTVCADIVIHDCGSCSGP